MNPQTTPFQNYSETPAPAPVPVLPQTPPKKGKAGKVLLVFLLMFLVGAAAAYGGYWYQKNKQAKVVVVSKTTTNQTTSSTVHYVSSLGYPYDTPTKQITSKVGFPSFLQAVRVESGNNNRGAEQFLTDKFNDELGRFAAGNPSNPSETPSELSILAIGTSWLASTTTADATNYYNFGTNSLKTPAQKQQYVAMVKSDTDACYKDSSKGFATSDGFFKVCYAVAYPKAQSASPVTTAYMSIEGYATIDQTPVVMVGYMTIYDSAPLTDKNVSTTLTPTASQKAKDIVSALSSSTFTVEPRPTN